MVWHLGLVLRGWLGSTNVHALVHLHGIAHHKFGVAIGQRGSHTAVALTASGWAKNYYRLHTDCTDNRTLCVGISPTSVSTPDKWKRAAS